jgi:hypothetical protein
MTEQLAEEPQHLSADAGTAKGTEPFPLGSAGEDEHLDGVDELGGPGRTGADPAEDLSDF